jgi:branched-chain amino acid transport system ATP-binding protein
MTMLAVTDLTAAYGRIQILNGISFAVAEREFVGILGHNGMGKTTLLKALIGAVRATGGQIRFEDRDVTALPAHRRARLGIGYVPQGREIFPTLSVLDNLRMATAALGATDAEVIDPVLEDFPRLKALLDRPGGALSGGEQQLLALARCLCGRPRLILLDEPTEGIQPSIIEEIVERLTMLRDRRGLTVVLVEQNLDFIRALSQRVLIIQKGRITQEVTPERLADATVVSEFIGVSA